MPYLSILPGFSFSVADGAVHRTILLPSRTGAQVQETLTFRATGSELAEFRISAANSCMLAGS